MAADGKAVWGNNGFASWPLHAAAARGDAGEVRRLLLFGAAVDVRNDAGCTPLHLACIQGAGNPVCVKLLLEGGATVDCVSGKGLTALATACVWAHGDCARLLLLAGADSQVRMPAHRHREVETISDWAQRVDSWQEAIVARSMRRRGVSRLEAIWPLTLQGYNHSAWVVRRNVLWSPSDHREFGQAGCKRAVQLLLLLARLPILPSHVWVEVVMPHAMGRAIEWCGDEPPRRSRAQRAGPQTSSA